MLECMSKMMTQRHDLKNANTCDTPVDPTNIEACHSLEFKVKLNNRHNQTSKSKDIFKILKDKQKLESVDLTRVGLFL